MNFSLRRYILTILIACVFTIILEQKVSRLYYKAYISAPRIYPAAAKSQTVDLEKYYNGSMDSIHEGNYVEAVRYIQNEKEKMDDRSKEPSDTEIPIVNGAETVETKSNYINVVPEVKLKTVVENAIKALKPDTEKTLAEINNKHIEVVPELKHETLQENEYQVETAYNEQNLPEETGNNHVGNVADVKLETLHVNDSKPETPIVEQNIPVVRTPEKDRQAKTDRRRKSELEEQVNNMSPDEIDKMYREMLKCRKLPDVLIIGFEKCGTVTLKSYLGIHPQIYIASLLANYKLFNRDSQTGVNEYTRHLPCTPNGQLRLEKLSTWGTVAKTAAVVPNAKLIAIVKEPVERSMSHYVHRTAKGIESKRYNFDTMIASIMDYNKPITLKSSVLFRQSKYIDRLKPWIEKYGLGNIHVIDGDNFVRNPAAELQTVEKFLGLKHYITEDHFVYNPVKKFYCLKQDGNEACMTSNKGRPHPEMSNATRTRLQEYYKPYNEQLFMTIGRKFSWNY